MAAVSSFATWEAWRVHQRLSAAGAARVLARTLRALLALASPDAPTARSSGLAA